MDSDKPVFAIIIRTSLLVINCIALGLIIIYHPDWLLISNLSLLFIIQIIIFVRHQIKLQQRLNSILSSLEQNIESREGFDGLRGELSPGVLDRLRRIEYRFTSLRIDTEKQNQFLQALIDNMRVGIIICDEKDKIELVNHMALELLQVKIINKLDDIKEKLPVLYSSILRLSDKQPSVQSLKLEKGNTTISIRTKNYKLRNKPLHIITMHIIQQEMEDKEMDSWQKLIRVLTHEIMNSTGPISSTLDTLIEILTDEKTDSVKSKDLVKQEMLTDVLKGLHIIKGRSIGLAHFVKHFRSLTLLPKPVLQPVNIEIFFNHILFLINHDLDENQIQTEITVIPSTLTANADPALIEQVLINLLKNSIEATKNISSAMIKLNAHIEADNRIILEVVDNGPGIPEELLDQIFVPFFTTRENGSGIGLSISRQIIRLHGGIIEVYSSPNIITTFRITL
jgi:two-component system nitrogen regulation sensor histidine kinase NtrY